MNALLSIALLAVAQSLVEPRLYAPTNYVYVQIPTDEVVKASWNDVTMERMSALSTRDGDPCPWNFFPAFNKYLPSYRIVGGNLAVAHCIKGNNLMDDDVVRLEDWLWLQEAYEERNHLINNDGDMPHSSIYESGALDWVGFLNSPNMPPPRIIKEHPSDGANMVKVNNAYDSTIQNAWGGDFSNPYADMFSNSPYASQMPIRKSDITDRLFPFIEQTQSNTYAYTSGFGGAILGSFSIATPVPTNTGHRNWSVTYNTSHIPQVTDTTESASYTNAVWGDTTLNAGPGIQYNVRKTYSTTSYMTQYEGDDLTGIYKSAILEDGATEVVSSEVKDTISNPNLYISAGWYTNAVMPDDTMRMNEDCWIAVTFYCIRRIFYWEEGVQPSIIDREDTQYALLTFKIEENPVSTASVSNNILGAYSSTYSTFNTYCQLILPKLDLKSEMEEAYRTAFNAEFGEPTYNKAQLAMPEPKTYAQLVSIYGAHNGGGCIMRRHYYEQQSVGIEKVSVVNSFDFKYKIKGKEQEQ